MDAHAGPSFRFALNTSTLLPFGLDVLQQVSVAAEAGYEGIELWVRDILAYLEGGGSLKALRRFVSDSGVSVVNGIAFFRWADASTEVRDAAFQQAKAEMEMLAEIGCAGVAAPPFGDVAGVTLDSMAGSFQQLAEVARRIGVEPYLEFWGRAKTLSRVSQAVYVAMESGVAGPKILFDLFHMYTGGSTVESLGLLQPGCIGIVHANDYPASPARETIADSDRVFPGDGVGPTQELATLLRAAGYGGYLSLELFIADYGDKSALGVASEGLAKLRKAFGHRGIGE